MLIPIHCSDRSYPNKEPKQTEIYIEPENIVSVENILSPDGKPSGLIHIWTTSTASPAIVTEIAIGKIASIIENFYSRIIKEQCPFMYITSNIYLNVKHVSHIRDYGSKAFIHLHGSSAIRIDNASASITAERINRVLDLLRGE